MRDNMRGSLKTAKILSGNTSHEHKTTPISPDTKGTILKRKKMVKVVNCFSQHWEKQKGLPIWAKLKMRTKNDFAEI